MSVEGISDDDALLVLRLLRRTRTQNSAVLLLARINLWEKGNIPDSLIKHALQVALGQCRTLKILVCLDLLRNSKSLLV